MAFVYSFAENFRLIAIRNPAYALFAAFLASVFFVNGAAANAIAVLCFSTAWLLIIKDARSGTLSIPHAGPWVLAFLIAINLRLLLPPYGVPDAVPGTAITRGLLLIGLYGLTLYVYPRVKFQSILWLVAGAAFTCSFGAIAVYLSHLPADGRLTFFGRASHPIFGAGAMATGAVASIALLAYCADGRRAQTNHSFACGCDMRPDRRDLSQRQPWPDACPRVRRWHSSLGGSERLAQLDLCHCFCCFCLGRCERVARSPDKGASLSHD